jgi:helicase MOV-10
MERRPSVIVGDAVLVKQVDLPDDRWNQSIVHQVKSKELSLRFPDRFSIYRGDKVDVRFQLNRLPFRRMIQAITTSYNPSRILFPVSGHTGTTRVFTERIFPSNPLMESNEEQLNTISAIVHQPPGSVPFVVFGP